MYSESVWWARHWRRICRSRPDGLATYRSCIVWVLPIVSFPAMPPLSRMRTLPVSCDPPTLLETMRAVNQLKCGKVLWECVIYAEMINIKWSATLMCSIWNTGIIPTNWRRGVVVSIWKGRGETEECNNHKGVILSSVPDKVLARICQNFTVDCILAPHPHWPTAWFPVHLKTTVEIFFKKCDYSTIVKCTIWYQFKWPRRQDGGAYVIPKEMNQKIST